MYATGDFVEIIGGIADGAFGTVLGADSQEVVVQIAGMDDTRVSFPPAHLKPSTLVKVASAKAPVFKKL